MSAWPPIEDVLPHRGTMLLLDRVEAYAPTHVRCSYTPRADAWYADADGAMPAWYGIELMAQTVAAHVGLTARQAGRPPRLGALLGSRAFRTQRRCSGNWPRPVRRLLRRSCGVGGRRSTIRNSTAWSRPR